MVAANDLSEVLSLSEPRTDNCEITPLTPPTFNGCDDLPLSDLQSDTVKVAMNGLVKSIASEHPDIFDEIDEELTDLNNLDTTKKVTNFFDDIFEKVLKK